MTTTTLDAPETSAARPTAASPAPSRQDDVFQQVGAITRQLHDTLLQLGLMPRLQVAACGIPDARSRLHYVAEKTALAANKVLTSVEQAKAEQESIKAETRRIADAVTKDPVRTVASGALLNFVTDVDQASARIDGLLTDIMLAQDFHDLTGQVVAKVVTLASDLEDSLLKLLMQVIPEDQLHKVEVPGNMHGPLVSAEGRTDVVKDQGEVDDLLASLGF